MPEIKKEEIKTTGSKPQGVKIEWPKKPEAKVNIVETKVTKTEEKKIEEPITAPELVEEQAYMNKILIYAALIIIIGISVIWHYRTNISNYFAKANLPEGQISDNQNQLGIAKNDNQSFLTTPPKNSDSDVKSSITIPSPYLGVHYFPVTPEIKTENNLSVDYGELIKAGPNIGDVAVVPDSPADKAGIRTGDVILEIDGIKLDDTTDLATIIMNKNIGDEISLKIVRDGVEQIIPVTLGSNHDMN